MIWEKVGPTEGDGKAQKLGVTTARNSVKSPKIAKSFLTWVNFITRKQNEY